jgi:hypothetical protein
MEITVHGSSSWMSYAPQGVKGSDDDDDDDMASHPSRYYSSQPAPRKLQALQYVFCFSTTENRILF